MSGNVTKPRPEGRPLLFQTGDELDAAITKALEKLRENGTPLIVENIAMELDCSPHTLSQYRMRSDYRPEFLKPIQKMLEACRAWQASKLFTSQQVAGPIFALKNNFPDDYRDKSEVEQSGSMKINREMDDAELADLIARTAQPGRPAAESEAGA